MTEQTEPQTTEGVYRPLKLDREEFRGYSIRFSAARCIELRHVRKTDDRVLVDQ